MKKLFLAAALAALPAAAGAAPLCDRQGAETVFHCKIQKSSRQVTVCALRGGDFLYVYGRPGRPEMELRQTARQVTYTPWNGVGFSFWAALRFDKGSYGYEVAYDADKDGRRPIAGGVTIFGPGGDSSGVIGRRECRPGTVETRLEEISARFD